MSICVFSLCVTVLRICDFGVWVKLGFVKLLCLWKVLIDVCSKFQPIQLSQLINKFYKFFFYLKKKERKKDFFFKKKESLHQSNAEKQIWWNWWWVILCFNCVDHVKNVTGFWCIVDLDRHTIIAYHLLSFFFFLGWIVDYSIPFWAFVFFLSLSVCVIQCFVMVFLLEGKRYTIIK